MLIEIQNRCELLQESFCVRLWFDVDLKCSILEVISFDAISDGLLCQILLSRSFLSTDVNQLVLVVAVIGEPLHTILNQLFSTIEQNFVIGLWNFTVLVLARFNDITSWWDSPKDWFVLVLLRAHNFKFQRGLPSVFKSFYDFLTLQKLHEKIPRECHVNLIGHLILRVNSYDYRNAASLENVAYLL